MDNERCIHALSFQGSSVLRILVPYSKVIIIFTLTPRGFGVQTESRRSSVTKIKNRSTISCYYVIGSRKSIDSHLILIASCTLFPVSPFILI